MKKTVQNSRLFRRLLALGSFCIALLFTSCSNDAMETISPKLDKNQDQMFALVPNSIGLTEIKGTLDVSENTAARTTQAAGDDRGRFNITFRYLVPLTERQLEVFESAAARWERIIIKDVPSITGPIPSAFQGVPPIEAVDDIVIEVVIAPIDGPGGILSGLRRGGTEP